MPGVPGSGAVDSLLDQLTRSLRDSGALVVAAHSPPERYRHDTKISKHFELYAPDRGGPRVLLATWSAASGTGAWHGIAYVMPDPIKAEHFLRVLGWLECAVASNALAHVVVTHPRLTGAHGPHTASPSALSHLQLLIDGGDRLWCGSELVAPTARTRQTTAWLQGASLDAYLRMLRAWIDFAEARARAPDEVDLGEDGHEHAVARATNRLTAHAKRVLGDEDVAAVLKERLDADGHDELVRSWRTVVESIEQFRPATEDRSPTLRDLLRCAHGAGAASSPSPVAARCAAAVHGRHRLRDWLRVVDLCLALGLIEPMTVLHVKRATRDGRAAAAAAPSS